jgi:putative ABC transport system substrate-binding protein
VKRRTFAALLGGAAACPLVAYAQQAPKVIGFLSSTSRSSAVNAFTRGLRELGYVEGGNFVFEMRFADGNYERLPGLAADLVRLNASVIVVDGSPAVRAAQRTTDTIPIVIASTGDAVASGLVASLARPGGNTTGISNLKTDLSVKHFDLLKLLIPKLERVALLINPSSATSNSVAKSVREAGPKAGVAVVVIDARSPDEIERGFAAMAGERVEAVMIASEGLFISRAEKIGELAARHALPSISEYREFAAGGALMTYGPNRDENFRRAASYVDKIFKGARPGDLPVEQPTQFELAINLKTAKVLGLTIPPTLLARADELIE